MINISIVEPQSQAKDVARDARVIVDITSGCSIVGYTLLVNDTAVVTTTAPILNGIRLTYDPGKNVWRHRETVSLYVSAEDSDGNSAWVSDEFTTLDHNESIYELAHSGGWSWDRLRLIPDAMMTRAATHRITDIDLSSCVPDHLTKGGVNTQYELDVKDIIDFGNSVEPAWIISLSHGWAHMRGFRKSYIYGDTLVTEAIDPCLTSPGVTTHQLGKIPKQQTPIFVGYFENYNGDYSICTQLRHVRSFTPVAGQALSSKCTYDSGYCSAIDDNDPEVDARRFYAPGCRSHECPLLNIDSLENTILWPYVAMNSDEFIFDSKQNKLIFNGSLPCNTKSENVGYSAGVNSQRFRTMYFPISQSTTVYADGVDVTSSCRINYTTGEIWLNTIAYPSGQTQIVVVYNPVYVVVYEPDYSRDYVSSCNIHPIVTGSERGFVCITDWDMTPQSLRASIDRDKVATVNSLYLSHNVDVYGPVYLGGDHVPIDIQVVGTQSTHLCPLASLRINSVGYSRSDAYNDYLGRVNGIELGHGEITVKADCNGVARLTYQPPRSHEAVGVTVKNVSPYVVGNYIMLPDAVPYSELVDSDGNSRLYTFVIRADDTLLGMYYSSDADKQAARERGETVWDEWGTPGTTSYGCNGRKELLASVSTHLTSRVIPVELRKDDNITVAGPGDMVRYIYYPVALPADCVAFYLNLPKIVTITAEVEGGGYIAFGLQIVLPQHMTGEFMIGGPNYAGAKSFDGISYFTLNPFSQPFTDTQYDVRAISTVFSVLSSESNRARTKFSVQCTYPNSVRPSSGVYSTAMYPFAVRTTFNVITMLESLMRTTFCVTPQSRDMLRVKFGVVDVHTIETGVTADIVEELMTPTTLEFDTLIPRSSEPREMN